jgi:hypothetical protein
MRRALDSAPVHAIGCVVTAAAEEPGYSYYYGSKHEYGVESAPPVPAPELELQTPADDVGSPPPDAPPVDEAIEPSPPLPQRDAPAPALARDALYESVFADRVPATNGQPHFDPVPGSVGVQPRRSWAQRPPTLAAPEPAGGPAGGVADRDGEVVAPQHGPTPAHDPYDEGEGSGG